MTRPVPRSGNQAYVTVKAVTFPLAADWLFKVTASVQFSDRILKDDRWTYLFCVYHCLELLSNAQTTVTYSVRSLRSRRLCWAVTYPWMTSTSSPAQETRRPPFTRSSIKIHHEKETCCATFLPGFQEWTQRNSHFFPPKHLLKWLKKRWDHLTCTYPVYP